MDLMVGMSVRVVGCVDLLLVLLMREKARDETKGLGL
jgi:hypothetical protein